MLEHLLDKSKRKMVQFNRYFLLSFFIFLANFFLTFHFPELFSNFLNFFFYFVFILFALFLFDKVRQGFNLISENLYINIYNLLLFNAIVSGLLMIDLVYILSVGILSELNCLESEKYCHSNISVKFSNSKGYLYAHSGFLCV